MSHPIDREPTPMTWRELLFVVLCVLALPAAVMLAQLLAELVTGGIR